MRCCATLHLRLLPYWQDAATREGYDTIQEVILEIYRETGSLRQTAARMNFSLWTIRNKLIEMHAPIRKPGGPNTPYGRAGKPTRDDDRFFLFTKVF